MRARANEDELPGVEAQPAGADEGESLRLGGDAVMGATSQSVPPLVVLMHHSKMSAAKISSTAWMLPTTFVVWTCLSPNMRVQVQSGADVSDDRRRAVRDDAVRCMPGGGKLSLVDRTDGHAQRLVVLEEVAQLKRVVCAGQID